MVSPGRIKLPPLGSEPSVQDSLHHRDDNFGTPVEICTRTSGLGNRRDIYFTTGANGRAGRARTGGLLVPNQTLSQLSYSPLILVDLSGIEPES